eukprot:584723-Pyramimonas_sp.AAC.1
MAYAGFMRALLLYEKRVFKSGGPFVELDVDEPVITTRAGVSAGDYTSQAAAGDTGKTSSSIRV